MRKNELPDPAYLHECFIYEPDTGLLKWKERPLSHFTSVRPWRVWSARFANQVAGTLKDNGYINVAVDYRVFRAHRIIWVLQTGNEPTEIDHRNGNRSDNRWHNLFEVTHRRNQWNRSRIEPTLPRGVTLNHNPRQTERSRYRAQACINGITRHLGFFPTPEAAHAAWLAVVEEERSGDFFRTD